MTTYVPPALVGDFNDDETVDAADYTVWRDNLGSAVFLPNDQTPGMVTSEDYDDWKANFGASLISGSGRYAALPVPEANSAWMVLLAITTVSGTIATPLSGTRGRRVGFVRILKGDSGNVCS